MPPISTYRLQLRAEFGFADAAAVVPYLADLGVSHVYCSPILQAASGSAHGYDVVDHTRISSELGGEAGWALLVDACHDHGLGIIVDVVPNHMAMPTPESLNPELWRALQIGPASEWLDVDWLAHDGKIWLPVLGRPLAEAIADGELTVDLDAAVVRYFDHEFPLRHGPLDESSPNDADAILNAQPYVLGFWRDAAEYLNYRRFFDVTTLLGIRVEAPDVFDATHHRLLELLAAGDIDGLRIDHPDGLADPAGYLERLAAATGDRWTVVEKILEPGERLPADWRCAGTTGYDALAAVTSIFLDPEMLDPMQAIWADRAGQSLADWPRVVDDSKRLVLSQTFTPEIKRLVSDIETALSSRSGTNQPLDHLRLTEAATELLVGFEVYRAYPSSLHDLDDAAARAVALKPGLREEIDAIVGLSRDDSPASQTAVTRLAQTTGPVMAKGVEDTALYRFHRLLSVNEVGGAPGGFGRPLSDFHRWCAALADDWPASMTTLSTHDTKRSEDVRARLLVLPEVATEWTRAVADWDAAVQSSDWPTLDAPTRYLIWQTVVGASPLTADRLAAYLEKATREAKLNTSWTDPNSAYDEAVRAFAERLMSPAGLSQGIAEWADRWVVVPGRVVALGQKLVQLTMPGVPDIYQGNEMTDLSLVDPDNRRPVDWTLRQRTLAQVGTVPLPDLDDDADGVVKLAVTAAALRLRREQPSTFCEGSYWPLEVHGSGAKYLVAFARADATITLATRMPVTLDAQGGWRDTTVDLPAGDWHDRISDRPVTTALVSDLLQTLPIALLTRADGVGL